MNKTRLLLAEDDPNLSLVLKDYLELQGYKVCLCNDGQQATIAFRTQTFDICVLDIMMPKKDGFSLAEDIRKTNHVIPIVFLTAREQKEDKIKGFKIGCDDYITKPFSTEELSLRLEAILRRCQFIKENEPNKTELLNIGLYNFDYKNQVLKSQKKIYTLTKRETDLLKFLFDNKNDLISREKILKQLWSNDSYFNGRSMDVFITRLRKYLKEDKSISIINVHGTGFKFIIEKEN
jgi:two-component system, OmpR family, response regulator